MRRHRLLLFFVYLAGQTLFFAYLNHHIHAWVSAFILPAVAFMASLWISWYLLGKPLESSFWRYLSRIPTVLAWTWRVHRCRHRRIWQRTWVHQDGTPMVTTRCLDCGLRDEGPYYR